MVFDALSVAEVHHGVDEIIEHLAALNGSSDDVQRGQRHTVASIERYLKVESNLRLQFFVDMRDQLSGVLAQAHSDGPCAWSSRVADAADSEQLALVIVELLDELRLRGTLGAMISRIHGVLRQAVDRENDAMMVAPK